MIFMKRGTTFRMVLTAMFASMICVATMCVQIKSPMGGYVNLGDALVLQYLNNVELDYAKIQAHSDMAKRLLSYIQGRDPNQERGGEGAGVPCGCG